MRRRKSPERGGHSHLEQRELLAFIGEVSEELLPDKLGSDECESHDFVLLYRVGDTLSSEYEGARNGSSPPSVISPNFAPTVSWDRMGLNLLLPKSLR